MSLALLIEDHPIVRAGCRRVLQGREGLDVIEASTAAEGARLHRERRPDLVILDLSLPDANGLDLLRELRAENATTRILVFSMYEDAAFVARALEAGAAGYVTKNDDPDTLLDAVDKALQGGIHLGHALAQKLALRQLQVLDLLGAGCNLSEIAARLAISYRTVANVSSQLKGKLGVASASALIKLAVEQRRS